MNVEVIAGERLARAHAGGEALKHCRQISTSRWERDKGDERKKDAW